MKGFREKKNRSQKTLENGLNFELFFFPHTVLWTKNGSITRSRWLRIISVLLLLDDLQPMHKQREPIGS